MDSPHSNHRGLLSEQPYSRHRANEFVPA